MASAYEIRVQRLNETPDAPKLEAPETAFQYWESVITTMPWYIPDREVCVVITLNTRLRVTGHSLVSVGSLNESVVHSREVFRAAVAMNAYAVVLMHSLCGAPHKECYVQLQIMCSGLVGLSEIGRFCPFLSC